MAVNAPEGTQKRLTRRGGALQKYRLAVVGEKGLFYFLLYEALATCVAPLGGRTGRTLRRLLYPLLFRQFGRDVTIEKNVVFRNPSAVVIADHVHIKANTNIDVKCRNGEIRIGERVTLGESTIVSCAGGILSIGNDSSVGEYCRLGSYEGLQIGEECIIEEKCYLIGAEHSYEEYETAVVDQPVFSRGKTILANQVRVLRCSSLLDGVNVAAGATVCAESLVTENVAAGAVVAGVPAVEVDSCAARRKISVEAADNGR